MRRGIFLFPAAAVILLDRITKLWSFHHLALNSPRPFLDHVLFFTLTFNERGAFSLFSFSNHVFLVLNSLLLLGLILYIVVTAPSPDLQVLLGCIVGGGVGNLIDRHVFGSVLDFLDLRYWPVFNLADSAVSLGVAGVLAHALFKPPQQGKRQGIH